MLNIPELEKKWLRYKIKSFIPHVIILLSFFVILILFLTFISEDTMNAVKHEPTITVSSVEQDSNSYLMSKKHKIEPVYIKQKNEVMSNSQLPPSSSKLELKPSFTFMQEMQDSMQPYYESEKQENSSLSKVEQKTPSSVVTTTDVTEVKEEGMQKETPQDEVFEEPIKINIQRKNTKNDIQEIIRRFKKNNNPALSLFVAKKYYELGDYSQSYNYALITNQLNRDIEASWIIFSKSLVKLGKQDMAIKTLKEYIQYSHSERAMLLLNEITSGKFK